MKNALYFLIFSLCFIDIALAENIIDEKENLLLKITDDNSLILEKDNEGIIIKEYYSEDLIEAILYDNFIVYNGPIGLYLYNIDNNKIYLLNSVGSGRSAQFYSEFSLNNDLLKISVGIEAASMDKFCIYNLKKLSDLSINDLEKVEKYKKDDIYPHFYNMTNEKQISFCGLEDDKYYYNFEWEKDDKISFMTCSHNDFCELNNFDRAESHRMSWDELSLFSQKLEDSNIIFADILPENSVYQFSKTAYIQNWLTGYPDGTLRPTEPVNRAEFAKMLMLAFQKGEGNGENLSSFPDIEIEAWYVPFLSKAVEEKIMKGYWDGEMKPGNNISLVEGVKMTLEGVGEGVVPVGEDQAWYDNYMLSAKERFPNLKFLENNPDHQLTRGECIELISAGLGLYN